jgi:Mycothiol maleylpyruvate isomerase N-terminal domain
MSEITWPQIIVENEKETRRLEGLVHKLTDRELSHPMNAGWTVSSVLAHLVFWDIRAMKLIDKWKQSGVEYSSLDTDVINEVTREIFIGLPPRVAADLAVEKARMLDRMIRELEPGFIEKIRTVGQNVRLERYIHRRLHLDEIEQALKIE